MILFTPGNELRTDSIRQSFNIDIVLVKAHPHFSLSFPALTFYSWISEGKFGSNLLSGPAENCCDQSDQILRTCRYGIFADMPIRRYWWLPICRYCRYFHMRGVHILDWIYTIGKILADVFADMASNADIQISAISALKVIADSRYADIGKKCWYADVADADINIGTSLPDSLDWPAELKDFMLRLCMPF